jgi:uncharacterized membrane protein
MLADSTPMNIAAVIVYFLIWGAYESLFDSRFRRPDSLNAKMVLVRNAWAARMLARETVLVDSNLVGHSIHTATFLASTTVLILAGLLGVLGSSDRIYAAVSSISMIIASDQRLFEWKIGLIIVPGSAAIISPSRRSAGSPTRWFSSLARSSPWGCWRAVSSTRR